MSLQSRWQSGTMVTDAWRFALIAAAAWAVVALTERLGTWPGLQLWAGASLATCIVAALVDRARPAGRSNGRNRPAAVVLGWGDGLGRTWAIVLAAWIMWALVGAAGVMLFGTGAGRPVLASVVMVSWVLYARIVAAQIGHMTGGQAASYGGARAWVLAALPAAMIGVSAALWAHGWHVWALIVPASPVIVSVGCYLAMLLFVLLMSLF